MPLFGAAGKKPGKLTVEQINKLVTDSRGKEEMREVLKRFGGKQSCRNQDCILQEWQVTRFKVDAREAGSGADPQAGHRPQREVGGEGGA